MSSIILDANSIAKLRAMGLQNKILSYFYLFNSFLISTVGYILSFIFFKIIFLLDRYYNLLNFIFPEDLYTIFNIEMSLLAFLFIYLCNLFIILLSTLFPIYKIYNMDIINAMNIRGS